MLSFGSRGGQEPRGMKQDDSTMKNDDGVEFVPFTEDPKNTRQGRLQSKNIDFQPG